MRASTLSCSALLLPLLIARGSTNAFQVRVTTDSLATRKQTELSAEKKIFSRREVLSEGASALFGLGAAATIAAGSATLLGPAPASAATPDELTTSKKSTTNIVDDDDEQFVFPLNFGFVLTGFATLGNLFVSGLTESMQQVVTEGSGDAAASSADAATMALQDSFDTTIMDEARNFLLENNDAVSADFDETLVVYDAITNQNAADSTASTAAAAESLDQVLLSERSV
uniref:Uncharacterized protein n=1 Tax=Grammatophora oceanica TaxID=210454 RepID=A0A7S1UYJ1_9STRA|mmetsp:Transcript_29875/g.44120  ORF Transcript_29875/g.44120 Transcript_29875/m.44120 type:complete len:228 (+) Transcript_29875:178-861(+)